MMDNAEPLKTIISSAELVFKEKGSVFLGSIHPVKGEEEILSILKEIRKKHYGATHHCYAYRLRDNSFKYSDDGEPGGTAGIRILNAIDHFGITDVLCVVVRWFGGTKLGVGPLGKAYYISAENVIKTTDIVLKSPFIPYLVKASYDYTNLVFHIFEKYKVKIINTSYDDVPVYESLFPLNNEMEIISELKHQSNDNIKLTLNGNIQFL